MGGDGTGGRVGPFGFVEEQRAVVDQPETGRDHIGGLVELIHDVEPGVPQEVVEPDGVADLAVAAAVVGEEHDAQVSRARRSRCRRVRAPSRSSSSARNSTALSSP